MRACLFFSNFGPYHVARIAAVAEQCTVLPVELWANSAEYLWGDGRYQGFLRTTLVGGDEVKTVGRPIVCERLVKTLARLKPDVLAVPGWSGAASLVAIRWARAARVPVI